MSEQATDRAISLKPAWAWAVLHGKGFENRTWWTAWRGLLYLHSSVQVRKDEHAASVEAIRIASGGALVVPPLDELYETIAGRLLGRMFFGSAVMPGGFAESDVADPATARERFLLGQSVSGAPSLSAWADDPWVIAGMYSYKLADVRRLVRPVPCPGRQGIWKVPPDALAKAEALVP